jgi:hypothetical protein
MEFIHATTNKREESERRDFTWRTVFYGFTRSRRHVHRRGVDDAVVFLDWHHPWLFFLATGTMLLSVADAFLTLQLLDRGMIEVNPVMSAVMSHGTLAFTATKLGVTAFGILALVFLAKSRFLNRIRTGLFLTIFFSFYSCLVCYELVSFFRIM